MGTDMAMDTTLTIATEAMAMPRTMVGTEDTAMATTITDMEGMEVTGMEATVMATATGMDTAMGMDMATDIVTVMTTVMAMGTVTDTASTRGALMRRCM